MCNKSSIIGSLPLLDHSTTTIHSPGSLYSVMFLVWVRATEVLQSKVRSYLKGYKRSNKGLRCSRLLMSHRHITGDTTKRQLLLLPQSFMEKERKPDLWDALKGISECNSNISHNFKCLQASRMHFRKFST